MTEFEKGALITSAILRGENVPWSRLFKKFCFFKAFEHFIQILIISKTSEDHVIWFGFARSKIKKLVEKCSSSGYLELRPYPFEYKTNSVCPPDFNVISAYYIGIRVKGGDEVPVDLIDFTNTRKSFFDWLNTVKQIGNNPAV